MNSKSVLLPARRLACLFIAMLAAATPADAPAADVEKPQASPGDSNSPRQSPEQLFAVHVYPLFQSKCFGCHGDAAKELKGQFDMRSRAGLLAGGESGDAAIVPGQPSKSPLYEAVNWDGLEMPPKKNDRLTPGQIAWIRDWIRAGAPWPAEAERKKLIEESINSVGPSGVVVATSGGQSEQWERRRYDPRDLWALQPVKKHEVPWRFLDQKENGNPVDAFIQRRLTQAELKTAPRADKRTLIRRATYDLTGLPPTPAEIDEFLADTSPQSFEKVVNRLLASKQYGAQMARHWLDVVRYADSAGFSNDFARPNAWRYRDYVIRRFNQDTPYDEFARQQIAGDEIDPDNPENLIAVGFLRMGPWEHTGMSVAAVTRQQFLDDVTHSIGVTFLATEMRCCKCHDHKFDPVPQNDYYRLQAVFAPVQFADRKVPFLECENTAHLADEQARIERLMKDDGIRLIVPPDATEEQQAEAQLGVSKVKKKQRQIRQRDLNQFKPLALSIYNGPPTVFNSARALNPVPQSTKGAVQDVFLLAGGALESPQAKVTPGVLSAAYQFSDKLQPARWSTIPAEMHGRREALADWIASPQNPLTARVMVNRVWQWHFGKGIAGNSNNFGKMGAKPTHPELLDWLAEYFIANGWSVKSLHRLIMTSEVYQRASSHPAPSAVSERDPENHLLGQFPSRRLAAEELRDAMLAVSGELNLEMGGLPIRPEINLEIALQPRHVMGSVAAAYQPSRTPDQRNRRTIYAQRIRTLRDPVLEVFDQPGSDMSCERRVTSTVTPQVFALFNGQSTYNRALAMALRLEASESTIRGQVTMAFRLAYGRSPKPDELAVAQNHIAKMTKYHQENQPQVVQPPKSVVRLMVEEMTGLTFQWEEQLDIYQNYKADVKPWDVAAETRGLADFCLVLFNSNEFIYVY